MRDAAMPYDSRPDTEKHIGIVRDFLSRVIASLVHRHDVHDKSKLESPEVETFNEFTPKLAESTYGSDEYKSFLAAMKPALDHHYAANSHHPEHYPNGIQGMSLLDLTEMLCDWKAATMRHNDGDILKSIEINQKRFGYSDELKQILLNTLPALEPSELTSIYDYRVGDRVMIDTCEGFGGPAKVVETRLSPNSRLKVRLDDGSQTDFWAHDFEVSSLRKVAVGAAS